MTRTLATTDQIAAAKLAGAVIPPKSWDVVIYSQGKVVASWYDARGRKQCAYSSEAVADRNRRKFAEMVEFGASLPNIRKAVASDLHSANQTARACAAIVAIMDQTTMRVGGAEYAAENGTYGASSLLKSHVSIDGETVRFSFTGKHHKSHDKSVSGAALVEAIEFFVATEGDKLFPVTETAVRAYLSAFGATPKQFRTYHASRVCSELLDAAGPAADAKAAKANINRAVKQVSELLGNTPAMARNSYIDPTILAAYAAGM